MKEPTFRPPAVTTVEDVGRLMELMGKYGVTQLDALGVKLVKPLAEPGASVAESKESELERLSRMPIDQQDRALMIKRTAAVG